MTAATAPIQAAPTAATPSTSTPQSANPAAWSSALAEAGAAPAPAKATPDNTKSAAAATVAATAPRKHTDPAQPGLSPFAAMLLSAATPAATPAHAPVSYTHLSRKLPCGDAGFVVEGAAAESRGLATCRSALVNMPWFPLTKMKGCERKNLEQNGAHLSLVP